MSTVTIQQFAFNLATLTRKTLEASTPFHTAYVKADAAQQKDLRHRWMRGHIMGSLGMNEVQADRVLSQTRTQRSKDNQKAVMRANSDFAYHVARNTVKDVVRSDFELTAAQRAALKALDAACATYPEMRSALNAYLANV